jgi:GTPase SAR1 family protein
LALKAIRLAEVRSTILFTTGVEIELTGLKMLSFVVSDGFAEQQREISMGLKKNCICIFFFVLSIVGSDSCFARTQFDEPRQRGRNPLPNACIQYRKANCDGIEYAVQMEDCLNRKFAWGDKCEIEMKEIYNRRTSEIQLNEEQRKAEITSQAEAVIIEKYNSDTKQQMSKHDLRSHQSKKAEVILIEYSNRIKTQISKKIEKMMIELEAINQSLKGLAQKHFFSIEEFESVQLRLKKLESRVLSIPNNFRYYLNYYDARLSAISIPDIKETYSEALKKYEVALQPFQILQEKIKSTSGFASHLSSRVGDKRERTPLEVIIRHIENIDRERQKNPNDKSLDEMFAAAVHDCQSITENPSVCTVTRR